MKLFISFQTLALLGALIAVATCTALPAQAAVVPYTLDPNQGGYVFSRTLDTDYPDVNVDISSLGYSKGSLLLSGDAGVVGPENLPEDYDVIQGSVFPSIQGSTTSSMTARNIPGLTFGGGVPSTAGGTMGGPSNSEGIIRYANIRPDSIGTSVTHHATHMATATASGNSGQASVTGKLKVRVSASTSSQSFSALRIPLNEQYEYQNFDTQGGSLPGNTTFYTGGEGPGLVNGPVTDWVEFRFEMSTNANSSAGVSGGYGSTQFMTVYSAWAYSIIPD